MDTLPLHASNGKLPTTPGIYVLINTANHKRYVGSAINLRRRCAQHFSNLEKGKHKNRHLQAAYVQYGLDTFVAEVLEHVELTENLVSREQYYLDTLHPEYNLSPTAGNTLGTKYSDEAKQRLSIARNRWTLSPESIAKGAAKRVGYKHSKEFGEAISARMKGWTPDDETRTKMSEAKKGKPQNPDAVKRRSIARIGQKRSPEAIAKTAAANKGRKHSDEARALMSEAQKRKPPISEETRAKLSAAGKGRIISEEARRKSSETQKGRVFSEETRLKMSIAAKNRRKRNEA